MEASPLPGSFRASPYPTLAWQAPPKRIGWRMAIHESRALLPTITVRAFIRRRITMPSADFCCEIKASCDAFSREFATHSRSPEVSSTAFRTQPPDLQPVLFDGYGLRCHMPTRPAPYASDPVLVHRLVRLLHASFRPSVTGTPLRFAITSPPSGCEKDFHLRAVEHARHTCEQPFPVGMAVNGRSILRCRQDPESDP
jgi:hypothetical protein